MVSPLRRAPNPGKPGLDFRSPIWQHPTMEMTASSFKLRANATEGRKAISYQLFPFPFPLFLAPTRSNDLFCFVESKPND